VVTDHRPPHCRKTAAPAPVNGAAELYSQRLQQELLCNGFFSRVDTQRFAPLVGALRGADPYMVLADCASTAGC
jgi:hypothetical protein